MCQGLINSLVPDGSKIAQDLSVLTSFFFFTSKQIPSFLEYFLDAPTQINNIHDLYMLHIFDLCYLYYSTSVLFYYSQYSDLTSCLGVSSWPPLLPSVARVRARIRAPAIHSL